jgi:predicted RNA-binding protein
MCELKVTLREDGKVADVAEDVVYVKLSERNLILRDVLGRSKIVEDALVDELDISKESLTLVKSPLLTKAAKFLSLYDAVLSSGKYDQSLEAAWEEVKAEGDRCIREAWARLGNKR